MSYSPQVPLVAAYIGYGGPSAPAVIQLGVLMAMAFTTTPTLYKLR